MKRSVFGLLVAVVCGVAFSQTAYDKCVQECIAAGGTLAMCSAGGEICNPTDTLHDVVQGQGNPLFLPSYQLKGPAPVINGSLLSRDTAGPWNSNAPDEWKEACSRTLILSDSGVVQLFLVNSPDTLYVGITYEHGNDGDGSGVRLLFDQGNNAPPSNYHGSGDMKLTAPKGIANENGCYIYKSGGSFSKKDLCWNGSAWIPDGDGELDFKAASYFYNTSLKVHHSEFAIPLHNKKINDSANSDLSVNYNDAIGFYIEIVKTGSGAGTFPWIETNRNASRPDTFPFWAKIQLSVQRDYFTFYTGRGSNPPPVINGAITEAAWDGAYQRELLLSNFHYNTYRSKIWLLEDSAQSQIYVGLRVFDKTHNPLDYCKIYFEEDGADTVNPVRNYILDNNAENAMSVTNGNQVSDLYWNTSSRGWVADPAAADTLAARAGAASLYTDYEFRVKRAGGQYNIDIPKGGLLGFLIRYHDADKKGEDVANYMWEYTTNNDAQLLENPDIYIATGWTNLQLGGPYLQVVSPATSADIHGVVPVRVSSGTDSLKSVVCFLSTDTTAKVSLIYQGSGIWTGSIDATAAASATNVMLIIRATTPANIPYERIINKADTSRVIIPSVRKSPRFFGVNALSQSNTSVQFLVNLAKPGSFGLEIYSMAGRKIWDYSGSNSRAGQQRVAWNATAPSVGSGTYLVFLKSNNDRCVRRFTILK
jgi:hypothetical protein